MGKRINALAVLCCLPVMFLNQCGKKGPLQLEPRRLPTAIRDISIRQVGESLILNWKFPALLSDGETEMDARLVSRVSIFHSETLKPGKPFHRQAEVIARLQAAEIKPGAGGAVSHTIPFKKQRLADAGHHFALRYRYRKKKSPLSPVRFIRTALPLPPVEDLRLEKQKKVVKLSWSKPATEGRRRQTPVLLGYNVYRSIDRDPFRQINRTPVLDEYYEDAQTGRDGTYRYRVSSVQGERIESEFSNIASVAVEDVYPPDPPRNLICFKTREGIKLIWDEAQETDVAHFNILRKTAASDEFSVVAEGVTINTFLDRDVTAGIRYRYAVTALDRKGNESPPSNIVSESF